MVRGPSAKQQSELFNRGREFGHVAFEEVAGVPAMEAAAQAVAPVAAAGATAAAAGPLTVAKR